MRILALAIVALAACTSAERQAEPAKAVAILEQAPKRHFEPLWPVQARARSSEGLEPLHEELRAQARRMDADAVIIERRYYDPAPAPGNEREPGAIGNAYPGNLERLERGSLPQGGMDVRTYGPYTVLEGLAIRFR